MKKYTDLINQLIELLTFTDAKVTVTEEEEIFKVDLTLPQEESGILIGYHGEKIDALQLITSLMFNQNRAVYKPAQIDINGYRQRRIDLARLQLAHLTNRIYIIRPRTNKVPNCSFHICQLIRSNLSRIDLAFLSQIPFLW